VTVRKCQPRHVIKTRSIRHKDGVADDPPWEEGSGASIHGPLGGETEDECGNRKWRYRQTAGAWATEEGMRAVEERPGQIAKLRQPAASSTGRSTKAKGNEATDLWFL
jgi:hypothetical protein